MADLTLLDRDDTSDEEGERRDRALALTRGVVIVAAPRSLVAGTRQGFREHVRQQLNCRPVGVVIDCAMSEYIDSSGLAALFRLGKEARDQGVGYCVARLDENLRFLLNITRIDCVIASAETLRSAILEASPATRGGGKSGCFRIMQLAGSR